MECRRLMLLQGEAALESAASLFAGMEDTLILTALQGEMGGVWCCAGEHTPLAACCWTGDFVFPAGDAASVEAPELLRGLDMQLDGRFAILTPPDQAWNDLIRQVFGSRAKAGERYAIHRRNSFDRPLLQSYIDRLPEGYSVVASCAL